MRNNSNFANHISNDADQRMKMTRDMKRNTQITNCRYLLLLAVMMVGGAVGAWGQKEEPANSKADGYSETWLRVLMTEALPSITGAKVIVLFETAK